MNEAPEASEGKAYRQSPNGPDIIDGPTGRVRRALLAFLVLVGLAALGLAAYFVITHGHRPSWQAPALAAGGVIVSLAAAVGLASGGRGRSTYRFDSSSSRALSTLGRMHGKD